MSETYLVSSTPDGLVEIDGYNLVRADHPNNMKRSGVCIYYKEAFPGYKLTLSQRSIALINDLQQ